jgi:hypothetical protein
VAAWVDLAPLLAALGCRIRSVVVPSNQQYNDQRRHLIRFAYDVHHVVECPCGSHGTAIVTTPTLSGQIRHHEMQRIRQLMRCWKVRTLLDP